ncbi:cation transporter [candidate division KSB1 bacterium]|nr:cation transporter [candidate division KSB1 bacterium]
MNEKRFEKYQRGKKGAWVGIGGNFFLTVIKLWAGVVGHSSALIADAVHSATDIFSSVTVLVGMKIAAKPADRDHPYGHGRAESIAGLVVAVFLVFIGLEIGLSAWRTLRAGGEYNVPTFLALGTVAFSIFVKEWLFRYKKDLARKLGSSSLMADAWHHRTDSISSAAAFLGIGGAMLGGSGWQALDHIAAGFISAMIIYVGIKIGLSSSRELMDRQPEQALLDDIRRLALEVEGVMGVEKLRVRKSGLGYLVDIHVEAGKDVSVQDSHFMATEVKNHMKYRLSKIEDVLVHVEPFFEGDH